MFASEFSFKQANRSAPYRNALGWEIRFAGYPRAWRWDVYDPNQRFVRAADTLYAAVGVALDAYLLPH